MRLWFDTKVWLDWWKHWFGQLKQSIFFPRDIPLINDTRDKIERTWWLEHFIYRLPIKNGWYEFNNIEDQSFVFKLIIFFNGDTVSNTRYEQDIIIKRISNFKWIFHVKIDRHKVYEFTCSNFRWYQFYRLRERWLIFSEETSISMVSCMLCNMRCLRSIILKFIWKYQLNKFQ